MFDLKLSCTFKNAVMINRKEFPNVHLLESDFLENNLNQVATSAFTTMSSSFPIPTLTPMRSSNFQLQSLALMSRRSGDETLEIVNDISFRGTSRYKINPFDLHEFKEGTALAVLPGSADPFRLGVGFHHEF